MPGDATITPTKRVTKKVATKAAAKKSTPKKTAAKKTTAKKSTAKKSTAKKTSSKSSAEAPLSSVEFIAESQPIPTAPKESAIENSGNSNRRLGRVPGGGPVASRKVADTSLQESTPFPSTIIHPPHREASSTPPVSQSLGQADSQNRNDNTTDQSGESRSKRRREKRKRKNNERKELEGSRGQQFKNGRIQNQSGRQQNQHGRQPNRQRHEAAGLGGDAEDRRPTLLDGPKIDTNGLLELAPKGFGFLRVANKNFEQARDDVFVSPEIIRTYNLRLGHWIHGTYQNGPRGPQLVEVSLINDLPPEEASKLPHFDELKAINPTRRISFETTPDRFTTRVVDIMAPVGRGQRGLIVSPPRSGKTTLLLHMAEAIREKYDEAIHLMVVLVDERPEEVTEFRRALPGAEIYASSNDEQARNHTRIAEIAIERAKRLVEAGKDVFLIMDSITRLARAYNGNMNSRGRGTASGGLTIGALEVPRRLFAAARNTRGGGSLTIMATALIQTNSRADEAIYMEFKGTGNMELVLDRKIAENYIYPAVDIFKSGTRREELLLADHMLHKIHLIRRGLSGHRPAEAMERLLFFLKKFPNNPQMLMEIKG